ncbi:putative glucose oxidase [Rosellinia necatrix]|uniref:Putative glucose oxidase n=1 Tax=Rosellinia necatrix TaxID=77044 RepID=A0A1W2TMR5_ROSNE|nr:putative glucose oxidase [Rosellinia necatrix]
MRSKATTTTAAAAAWSASLWLAMAGAARAETFDYIIAGAGTCGLVLANRLSADPAVRVAVIEPGEDVRNNANVTDPANFTVPYGTSIDWQYSTTPQPGAGNRTLDWHAGKAIGGTSTINGMTYIRGDKAQFDAWEALGAKGWNWETLYPYYKKAEKFTVPSDAQAAAGATYDPEVHGDAGHVHTGFPFSLVNGSLHDLAVDTWAALGYELNEEVNAGSVRGFGAWPQTLDRDRNIRFDAARAYYYDIEDRPNLTLIKGTVKKLTWASCTASGQDAVADGVEYVTPDGGLIKVTAAKEVILSAGALRSPLILESSGVGNPSLLSKLGIKPKIDLPGVGEYLQEQPNTALVYSGTQNVSGFAPYATFSTAGDLFGDETPAIKASTSAQIPGWAEKVVAASNGAVKAANVEKLFRIQHDLIFEKNVTIGETLTAIFGGEFLVSAMWLLLPFSWGSVHLTSVDAINAPAIDPKYFLVDFDLDVQIGLGRTAQKFWNTEPVSDIVGARVSPTDDDVPLNATDEQWAGYISDSLTPNHHPLGTASMMSRELGGVVDAELKVYGTGNVRVVDASVLPIQFSGHLTATLYAVAERAAEIIAGAV